MASVTSFIRRFGEHRVWDLLDLKNKGYTDEWIAENVLRIPRQHVTTYKKVMLRPLWVLSEPAAAVLRDIVEERRRCEDTTGQRLLSLGSIIEVTLDEHRNLRASDRNP